MRNWNLRLTAVLFACSLVLTGCDMLGLTDPSDANIIILQPYDWDDGGNSNAYWVQGLFPPVRMGDVWRVTLKGKADKAIPRLLGSLKLAGDPNALISDEGYPLSIPAEPIRAGEEFTRTFTFTINADADITEFGILAETEDWQKVYDTAIVLTLSENLKIEKIATLELNQFIIAPNGEWGWAVSFDVSQAPLNLTEKIQKDAVYVLELMGRVNTDLTLLGVLIDNNGGWKELSGYQTLATLQKNQPFVINAAFQATADATALQDCLLRLVVNPEDAPKDADPIIVTWDEFSFEKFGSSADANTVILQPYDWNGGGANAYWVQGLFPPVRNGDVWRVTLKGKADKAIPRLRGSLKPAGDPDTLISDEGEPLSVPAEPIRAGEEFTRTFTFTVNTDADVTEFGILANTEDWQKVYDTAIVLTLSENLKIEKIATLPNQFIIAPNGEWGWAVSFDVSQAPLNLSEKIQKDAVYVLELAGKVNTDLTLLGVLIDNNGGWKELSGYQTLATLQKNQPFVINAAFQATADATALQGGSLHLVVNPEDAPKDADPIIVTWDEFSLTKAVKTVTVNGLVDIDVANPGGPSAVYAVLNKPDWFWGDPLSPYFQRVNVSTDGAWTMILPVFDETADYYFAVAGYPNGQWVGENAHKKLVVNTNTADPQTLDLGSYTFGRGGETPSGAIEIRLEYNPYDDTYNWQNTVQQNSLLNGVQIVAGNSYVLAYSFVSDTGIGELNVALIDNCIETDWAWLSLSDYSNIWDVRAGELISGSITIDATATATNATADANKLVVSTPASPNITSAPTLAFTELSLTLANE